VSSRIALLTDLIAWCFSRRGVNENPDLTFTFRQIAGQEVRKRKNRDMTVHGKVELPSTVLALVAEHDRSIQQRNRLTVGELFAAIDGAGNPDPAMMEQRLLAIAQIGRDLLCGAICCEGMTHSGLEQARELLGEIVDQVLRHCGFDLSP
jgi:hypothetical protein